MDVLKSIKAVREWRYRQSGNYESDRKIAFVPTMGALHEGHLSLVKNAQKHADKIIVSIYVNPLQFNNSEDLKLYPRNIEKDLALLRKHNVDAVFLPSDQIMYKDKNSKITFNLDKNLSQKLCGKSRPGHFEGVVMIVSKLFNIIAPDIAFFGLKDYQQCKIIESLVDVLNFPVKLIFSPIIRDKTGLALSSRNILLSPEDRKKALALSKSLKKGVKLLKNGENSLAKIKRDMVKIITDHNLKIDYLEILSAEDLSELTIIERPILLAGAVYCGKVRLIDNILYP